MNEKLDNYLCKKYPKIFADRNKPMNQTCMFWGFDHGNGWFHLVDALCKAIQRKIDDPPFITKKNFHNLCASVWNWIIRKCHLPCAWEMDYDVGPKQITQVVASQVKEKFGGLRFYIRGGDDTIRSMIAFAEHISYKICENCGKMDSTVVCGGTRWIQTLCINCRKKEDRDFHVKALEERKELLQIFHEIQTDKGDPLKAEYSRLMEIVKKGNEKTK